MNNGQLLELPPNAWNLRRPELTWTPENKKGKNDSLSIFKSFFIIFFFNLKKNKFFYFYVRDSE